MAHSFRWFFLIAVWLIQRRAVSRPVSTRCDIKALLGRRKAQHIIDKAALCRRPEAYSFEDVGVADYQPCFAYSLLRLKRETMVCTVV